MADRQPHYYEALGKAHDDVLRCHDCKRLVVHRALATLGACPHCGNRRVTQVVALGAWEWIRIRLGLLNFDHRQEFLAEFPSFWQIAKAALRG